ncbi:glucuronate isomerase, partial [Microbacterium sp.]|uniref:glucuronate isomerase n=1 Tax=Microbacterium sp. TaxID=51671 RepID=UPI002736BD2E
MPEIRKHDRLLPSDPATRETARGLYERVRQAPIVSPHGHVEAAKLSNNTAFSDPAELFISHDHYVKRLLHAAGEQLGDLTHLTNSPRNVWSIFAKHQALFAGTAVAVWFADSMETVFGISEPLTTSNADELFDRVSEALTKPELRPQALFNQFGIE